MKRMTPAERRAVWEQRLERYSASDQTVADFCKAEGMARAQLPNGILISLGRDTTLAAAIVDRLVRYEPADEVTESNSTLHHESNSARNEETRSSRCRS